MHPFFDTPTPHLFGHRGASAHAPENTLPAFERACQAGVPYLETDCHATSDGEIVLLHDPEVNRTTDGEGRIGTLTFAEVERLDAGFRFTPDDGRTFPFRGTGVRIPRLVEVLERFADARINLEVKSDLPAVAEEVVRIVRRTGATERMLLAAGEDGVLEHIRKLDPGTALGSSLSDLVAFFRAVQKGEVDRFEPHGHALQIPPTFGEPNCQSLVAVQPAGGRPARFSKFSSKNSDRPGWTTNKVKVWVSVPDTLAAVTSTT